MAHGDEQQRLAVRRRLGDDFRRDDAVRARTIVADDRLGPQASVNCWPIARASKVRRSPCGKTG